MNKFIVTSILVALAMAAELPGQQHPSYPAAAYSKPKYYDYPQMPYDFAWAVKDEGSYSDYSHQQKNDGKITTGSYRVVLPDGRTQIVTYKADESGYVADVKYEGEAKPYWYKSTSYKPDYLAESTYSKTVYPAEPANSKPVWVLGPKPAHSVRAVYPKASYPKA